MSEPPARPQPPTRWGLAGSRYRAQGVIEYGLIIALVAVLAIAAFIIFGPALSSLATRLGGSV